MFTASHFIAAAVLQADGLADSLGEKSPTAATAS
jgi:hypothetical protein